MEALWDLLGFVGKSLVVFVTFAACVGFFFSRMRARRSAEPHVRLREVSARWKRNAHALKSALATPGKKRWGRRRSAHPPFDETLPSGRVFVIDFKGE